MAKCNNCGGTGRTVSVFNWQSKMEKCIICNGTGIDPKKQCKTCGGTGTIWNSVEVIPVHCWACKGKRIK